MNKLKYVLFTLSLFAFGMVIASCGGDKKAVDKTGIEYTSKYVCPMHCKTSGGAEAGKCPVCKMDYEKNKEYKPAGLDKNNHGHKHDHDGHDHSDHDHSHDGHDHGSHEGHNH